eukprot:g4208.t1
MGSFDPEDPFAVFEDLSLGQVGKLAFHHVTSPSPSAKKKKEDTHALDKSLGKDFDPFMLVMGTEKMSEGKKHSRGGASRRMSLEEMRQMREMNDMCGNPSGADHPEDKNLRNNFSKKMSFSDLVAPSPSVEMSKTKAKRLSFTDIIGEDNDFETEKRRDSGDEFADPFGEEEGYGDDDDDDDDDDGSDGDEDGTKESEVLSSRSESQETTTKVIRVRVPSGAKPGQIARIVYEGSAYNVAIPADAAKRGFGTFPVEVAVGRVSRSSESSGFVHGEVMIRQGRVFKKWISAYASYSKDGFLTLYRSKKAWMLNRDFIDQISIHGFMSCGEIYSKADPKSESGKHVWQMKILENDVAANASKIKSLKLWKIDDRMSVHERIKLGAINADVGKHFLESLQRKIWERIDRMQKGNLSAVQRKMKF